MGFVAFPSLISALLFANLGPADGSHLDGLTASDVRVGVYSWDASYWKANNPLLLDFIDGSVGRKFSSGSVYINIADYSSPDVIPEPQKLIQFAKDFRSRVGNDDAILFFTYGDVTKRDGNAMLLFTETFFNWIAGIPPADASLMGRIGLSYDVEHIHPDFVKRALERGRQMRLGTPFGEENVVLQVTIEGDRNILGTDYAFRYADSVLVMLYSNYVSSDIFPPQKSLLSRLRWLLTQQCEKCLQDDYAVANYRAKITLMVEASCKMGRSCSWASFCAHDAPDEGAVYLSQTLTLARDELLNSGLVTLDQYQRLFNLNDLFVVHNFEWYICFAPLDLHYTYSGCRHYHQLAAACRAN